jgi:hypothetical protein
MKITLYLLVSLITIFAAGCAMHMPAASRSAMEPDRLIFPIPDGAHSIICITGNDPLVNASFQMDGEKAAQKVINHYQTMLPKQDWISLQTPKEQADLLKKADSLTGCTAAWQHKDKKAVFLLLLMTPDKTQQSKSHLRNITINIRPVAHVDIASLKKSIHDIDNLAVSFK